MEIRSGRAKDVVPLLAFRATCGGDKTCHGLRCACGVDEQVDLVIHRVPIRQCHI